MHVQRSFVVDHPLEATFDYFSDFETLTEWDPNARRSDRLDGDGGLGTRYAVTSVFRGKEADLEYETIALQRPHRFICRGRNATVTATDDLTFAAEGERTRITYRAIFDFRFPINLVAPLILRGTLDSLAEETVESIQRVLAARTV